VAADFGDTKRVANVAQKSQDIATRSRANPPRQSDMDKAKDTSKDSQKETPRRESGLIKWQRKRAGCFEAEPSS
jgi:hypothetical protein